MAAAASKGKAPVDEAELKRWRNEEQAKERSKREREKAELGSLWSRRDFLGRLGWGGFTAFSLVGLLAAVRSAFPRVLFLPPSKFKAGLPGDYVVGEVSEKFKQDYRTWIIRTKAGLLRDLRQVHPSGLHAAMAGDRAEVQMPLPRVGLLHQRAEL